MRRALITGIGGQDGSYLTELLVRHGYDVHGFGRVNDPPLPAEVREKVTLHVADLGDTASIAQAVIASRPDQIYHLAGQSNVGTSFAVAEYTTNVTALGTLRVLEAMREHAPQARLFFAASSEMYGRPDRLPQTEEAPLRPMNPYAASKVYGFNIVNIYRTHYGLFACSGILFNHESPRRGAAFVTQKIARAAARIAKGLENELVLGNLESRRDWGYAGDYVEAMWRMLEADSPQDYVIASGVSHSVRDFCEEAFRRVDLDYRKYVRADPALVRSGENPETRGDASRAERFLGWKPRTSFTELVHMMVDAQRQALEGHR